MSKATGVKPVTIRFYEKSGVLGKPDRTGSNYRAYGEADLARLSFICRARGLGFSLEQIRALLALSDDRGRDCASVDEIARAHLEEVDRKLADLTALRRELKAVISSCSGGTVGDCRIIEALAPSR
jgi:Cu(I)-responsive transcriptional regulator